MTTSTDRIEVVLAGPHAQRVKDSIIGRMLNEGATTLSDAEIERTLSNCAVNLAPYAKVLRDRGLLQSDFRTTLATFQQDARLEAMASAAEELRITSSI